MKKIITINFIVIFGVVIQYFNLKSPIVNYNYTLDHHACIYSANYKTLHIVSMSEIFNINYVEHAHENCINPHFPAIHITAATKQEYVWLQVVYTDTKEDPKYKQFIDSTNPADSDYPFYTKDLNFYDAPIWNYKIFSYPLSFWHAHAWAIEINHNKKTIKPLGGISWGFNLSYLHFYPKMITPRPLSKSDFDQDWLIFKTAFYDYQIIL